MTTTQPQPIKPDPDDDNRILWLAVRRGLLSITKAIEVRYNLGEGKDSHGTQNVLNVQDRKAS